MADVRWQVAGDRYVLGGDFREPGDRCSGGWIDDLRFLVAFGGRV